jgi:hypothetical protein
VFVLILALALIGAMVCSDSVVEIIAYLWRGPLETVSLRAFGVDELGFT